VGGTLYFIRHDISPVDEQKANVRWNERRLSPKNNLTGITNAGVTSETDAGNIQILAKSIDRFLGPLS
jgi:hypothetical protein